MVNMEDKELAYIAGLFDGEVALQIHQKGHSYYLSVSYNKKDYDILKYLTDVFGGQVDLCLNI